MNIVETNNLTKYYGKSRGIENVNLRVEEGEIFGFIGPNGAGKSTTIRTILGLIHPTSGSAKIFGEDIALSGPRARNRIGYLPSEVFYYDDMKVLELLRYSASFYKKDCDKRIHELAESLSLDLKRKIDDLSYGNKKKVGIVQGLLHQPDLIILDEPTGGLDPLMQQTFFNLLREENRRGATILFSSHILSEVQKLCGRVAIIKDGTIIKTEKINSLLENSYKRFKLGLKDPADCKKLKINGVSDLRINQNTISFLFKGKLNSITKVVSEFDLSNMLVEDPDLEEIFLHYYEK